MEVLAQTPPGYIEACDLRIFPTGGPPAYNWYNRRRTVQSAAAPVLLYAGRETDGMTTAGNGEFVRQTGWNKAIKPPLVPDALGIGAESPTPAERGERPKYS
jgi:hypothetical protein